jgi:hypothetical protein
MVSYSGSVLVNLDDSTINLNSGGTMQVKTSGIGTAQVDQTCFWVKIAEGTFGSAATSMTISSIPSGYSFFKFYLNGVGVGAPNSSNLKILLNSINGESVYGYVQDSGEPALSWVNGQSTASCMVMVTSSQASDMQIAMEVMIGAGTIFANRSITSVYSRIGDYWTSDSKTAGYCGGAITVGAGTAITSLTITDTGSFTIGSGSVYKLMGIKNA